ncbi:YfiT family bacillithiol transferase [Patiriisocius hiemis]|uniref:Metal-dependent hydrolase n=1 Tax=Patiriisocius hiemis TaxID=3075604 RepID=A0ABU2YD98_9FLAO|nr:putative metal-dependent hydrolase [Constantimarinum sp. W242]MDT0555737.1 putative metal-dependent hydrolase [Constantimarinum sp. W242]
MNIEDLKYPIGKFTPPKDINEKEIQEAITILEIFPEKFGDLVRNLDDKSLDTTYRPEGWTIRQVVHHVADSHHHSYIRFKWALSEDNPKIKAYNQEEWSTIKETYNLPVAWSLTHIEVVHHKIVNLLRQFDENDWNTTFIHPENGETSLKKNALLYAWHSMHHYSHIANALERMK